MIPKFLLRVIEKNKERARQNKEHRINKEIESLGFKNKSEYHLFKQRSAEEAKRKVERANRKKLRKEIQDKTTYDLTHTRLQKFGDSMRKAHKDLKDANKQMKDSFGSAKSQDSFSKLEPLVIPNIYGKQSPKKNKKSQTTKKKRSGVKRKKSTKHKTSKRKPSKRRKEWWEL